MEVTIPKYGVVQGAADQDPRWEPQGPSNSATLGDTIDAARAQVAAAERAATQQAAQGEVQQAATTVEPAKPLPVTIGPDGSVLPQAALTGDFAPPLADFQPDQR